jgi:phage gp29-like protein
MLPKFVTGLLAYFKGDSGKQVLEEHHSGATLTGVRQVFHSGISRNLDPRRIASIMREADEGNPQRYMELAEEIEEKDFQYLSVLGTRKRQVAQLPMTVAAAKNGTAIDKKIAEAVQDDLVDSGVIDRVLFDMLDAVGKGYSLCEIIWDTSGARFKPAKIEHVDPRFVRFDRATMRIPMLLGDNGQDETLTAFKYIWLELKAKSGIPVRGGITRAAAWCWLFKNFGIKDWVQFAEVYGLPLRLGKYPIGASEEDKKALLLALAQIASDAAGIIPQNMSIDFQEVANKGSSADLFERLCKYFDEAESKMVLGQTGTTDATGAGGLGSGTEHTQVREDIERADANAVSAAINEYLVKPYVMFNFGQQPRYPWLRIGREDEADAKLMIEAAEKLVPLGLKIVASDIRQAVGFTEPKDDDDLLSVPAASASPSPFSSGLNPAVARALAAAAKGDTIDPLVESILSDWQPTMAPIMGQIETAIASAKTFEEARTNLAKIDPDVAKFAELLASARFQAVGGGALGATVK